MDETNQNSIPQATGSSSLDPQIVNLSQAIRQNESGGNFQDTGASGEQGAYQWMPETWAAESKQYLGADAPASPMDATPEQQNQVAYDKLADWKTQHPDWNVGNFASAWNAGEGNADAYQNNNVGTNAEGVNYDTPEYAKKVATTYQELKGGQPMSTSKGGSATPPIDTNPSPWKQALGYIIPGLTIAGTLAANAIPGVGEVADAALPEELAGESAMAAAGADATDIGSVAGTTGGISSSGILNTAGNIAKTAGTGLAYGAADNLIKGVLGNNAVGSAVSSAVQNQMGGTSQTQTQSSDDMEAVEQSNLNSQRISQTVADSLNQTQTGAKIMQTADGMQGLQNIGVKGYSPDITPEGRQDWGNAINDAGNENRELDDAEQDIQTASGDKGNLADNSIRDDARARIDKDTRIALPDRPEAYDELDRMLGAYKENMGDTPTLGRGGIAQIRTDGYAKWNMNSSSAKNVARQALGSAANHHMLNKSSHKDLIASLHKEKQKNINSIKIMKHLNEKKAPEKKGFLSDVLKHYGQYVGIALGDKIGGGLGAVIGAMTSKQLIKAVDKRFGKTEFETPAMKKALEHLKNKKPEVYKMAKKEIEKYGVKMEEMKKQEGIMKSHQAWQSAKGVETVKQLPAGDKSKIAIPMGAKTSIPEVSVLQANKNPVSSNPQSGKFQTSYNSSGVLAKKDLSKKIEGLFGGEVNNKSKRKVKSKSVK